MNENNINNNIQNSEVDQMNYDNKQNAIINVEEVDIPNSNKKDDGYFQSLFSNIYSIPFTIIFVYILMIVAKDDYTGSGSGFLLGFYLFIFGPGQLLSLCYSMSAASKYKRCVRNKMSFSRKCLHILNVINILVSSLFLTYVGVSIIIMLVRTYFGI